MLRIGFPTLHGDEDEEEGRKHTANLAHTHSPRLRFSLSVRAFARQREKRGGYISIRFFSVVLASSERPPCSKAKEKFCLNVSIGDKRGTLVCICTWRINTPQKKKEAKNIRTRQCGAIRLLSSYSTPIHFPCMYVCATLLLKTKREQRWQKKINKTRKK